jgi:hypothetical protein
MLQHSGDANTEHERVDNVLQRMQRKRLYRSTVKNLGRRLMNGVKLKTIKLWDAARGLQARAARQYRTDTLSLVQCCLSRLCHCTRA